MLDTNVLSELAKAAPHPRVLDFIARQRRSDLYTTAIAEAEIAYGLALLPRGRRKAALLIAMARLFDEGLGGRVLAFDREAAAFFGEFAAKRRTAGRPVGTADGQIAAIARVRGAELIATRDVDGFEDCGVTVANPWS